MPEPACYLCGRRTRKFLSRFALQEAYICRLCENGLGCRTSALETEDSPEYRFSRREIAGVPHRRRDRLLLVSHEALLEQLEARIRAAEEGFS